MLGLLAAFIGACTGNKNNSHPEGFAPAMDTLTYTCPMHSEIIRNAPGGCPVCGMDLVKAKEKTKTEVAKTYVCPMHADVTSDKPGKCSKCGMDLKKKEHKH